LTPGEDIVLQLRVDPEDGQIDREPRLVGEADVDAVVGLGEEGNLVSRGQHLLEVFTVRNLVV
jgi:hypothetical protein